MNARNKKICTMCIDCKCMYTGKNAGVTLWMARQREPLWPNCLLDWATTCNIMRNNTAMNTMLQFQVNTNTYTNTISNTCILDRVISYSF